MKIKELIQLSEQNNLMVYKKLYRENTRRKIIWDEDYRHIIEVKKIKYKIYNYCARTKDMEENTFYRITKKDYLELNKILNDLQSRQ